MVRVSHLAETAQGGERTSARAAMPCAGCAVARDAMNRVAAVKPPSETSRALVTCAAGFWRETKPRFRRL
jgi:hypothetical protein